MRAVARLALLPALAGPAAAQIEPSTPVRNNGVWTQLSAALPTGRQGEIVPQAGHLGGIGIDYVGLEGRRKVGGGAQLSAAYFHGVTEGRGSAPDRAVDLLRAAASWTLGQDHGPQLEARLWNEWIIPRGRTDYVLVRPRLRAIAPLPGVLPAIRPRLFVGDELFFRSVSGFDRNRLSSGVKATLGPVDAEVFWQRTDYERGPDIDTAVIQLSWRLGRPG